MISKKHNTLFVHIPKVAGQSIETVFLRDLGLDWQTRDVLLLRKKEKHEKGTYRLAHLKAKDYVELGYIDAQTYNTYFTFSFVRNPYNRTISLYKYLGYSRIISFSTFVNKVLPQKIQDNHFFFLPQYDYLYSDSNDLLVDFVGKLETIEEDCKVVFNKAGLHNATLPHVNKSEKGLKRGIALLLKNPSLLKHLKVENLFKKQPLTLSEEDKKSIQKLYRLDFKYFNYET